jgi:NifU-like protein involved in Fe-S cluster formation
VSALYSRDILRLAVAVGDFPPLLQPAVRVERRALLCGSHIVLDARFCPDGALMGVGFAVHACAIGQASSVLLARGVAGQIAAELAEVTRSIARWLDDASAPLPGWPDIALLAGVRQFPARRGAALLPFEAVSVAARQFADAAL